VWQSVTRFYRPSKKDRGGIKVQDKWGGLQWQEFNESRRKQVDDGMSPEIEGAIVVPGEVGRFGILRRDIESEDRELRKSVDQSEIRTHIIADMAEDIGDYALMECIGQGGYATIRKGIHIPSGQVYAVKIIERPATLTERDLELFKREADVMSHMNHPGVIRLHSVIETPSCFFLILDYASGGDLLDHIKDRGHFDEDTARRYFHELVDAVTYMHEQNVIHRDLKPENILFDEDGRLKICDFGFAIMQSSSTPLLKSHCGTPMYAAPEMFLCDTYIGPPVDVWSLGIILYVMLSGNLPFPATTVAELIAMIQNSVIKFPPFMSRDAIDLIRHMLVVDAKRRFRIEEIRMHTWFMRDSMESESTDPRTKEEEFVNAFELIGLLSEGRQAVTLNYDKNTVVVAMKGVVDMYDGTVCRGERRNEFVIDCTFDEGYSVRTRIDIMSIDDKCVIVRDLGIIGIIGREARERRFKQILFGIEQWLSMFCISD
jgi:serine/threonine protein kinase